MQSHASHFAITAFQTWMGGITSFCVSPHILAHIDRGPVYRVNLNHVAVPHAKTEMFRTEMIELGD